MTYDKYNFAISRLFDELDHLREKGNLLPSLAKEFSAAMEWITERWLTSNHVALLHMGFSSQVQIEILRNSVVRDLLMELAEKTGLWWAMDESLTAAQLAKFVCDAAQSVCSSEDSVVNVEIRESLTIRSEQMVPFLVANPWYLVFILLVRNLYLWENIKRGLAQAAQAALTPPASPAPAPGGKA